MTHHVVQLHHPTKSTITEASLMIQDNNRSTLTPVNRVAYVVNSSGGHSQISLVSCMAMTDHIQSSI
jgi:hypothetical protein